MRKTNTVSTTPTTTPPLPSGFAFFNHLPRELLDYLRTDFLGCRLELLDAPTTNIQKEQVVNLSSYHLIKTTNGDYELGFCNAQNQYKTKSLDEKGPLLAYIGRNKNRLLTSQGVALLEKNEDLLELVEKEIKAAQGKTNPANNNLLNLATAIDIKIAEGKAAVNPFKAQLLDIALVHVARGEQNEAEVILKKHVDLLFQKCESAVARPDHSSRTFKKGSTLFKLALWMGDWHMWEMMLRCIPQDISEQEKKEYCDKLLEQYDELITSVEYIDKEPDDVKKQHIAKTKNYLLINRKNQYSLGFCGADGNYIETLLPESSPLIKYVKESAYLSNKVLNKEVCVDTRLVNVANEIVEPLGGHIKGLVYTLDNLTLCGLRVIQGTPTQEQQDHAVRFNAYHLIITASSYSLGFYNQATKAYVQKLLTNNSPLKQHIKPDAANPDTLTRDSVILELAAKELITMGALIYVNYRESQFDLNPLMNAVDEHVNRGRTTWMSDEHWYHWTKIIGMLDRFLPPHILRKYLWDNSYSKSSSTKKDKLPLLDDLGFSFGYRGQLHPKKPSEAWAKDSDLGGCAAPLAVAGACRANYSQRSLSDLNKKRQEQLKNLRKLLVDCNLASLGAMASQSSFIKQYY